MKIKAFVHYNCELDQFDVVAWIEDNGQIQTVGLSGMDAQLYDKDGQILSYAVSNLAPEAIGIYNFDVVNEPAFIVNGKTYLLRLETTYNSNPLSTFIPFTITNI
jgi:hypothetical protein